MDGAFGAAPADVGWSDRPVAMAFVSDAAPKRRCGTALPTCCRRRWKPAARAPSAAPSPACTAAPARACWWWTCTERSNETV